MAPLTLGRYFERFARNLGQAGAVVRPFEGDIEQTRTQVLQKPWTRKEEEQIFRTPSLLMINVDFDDFSPREHPWMLLHFGEGKYGDPQGREAIGQVLEVIASTVRDGDENDDIFRAAYRAMTSAPSRGIGDIFEIKPEVYGLSIDVVRGGQHLVEFLRRQFVPRHAREQ